jgi:hypothetical protein
MLFVSTKGLFSLYVIFHQNLFLDIVSQETLLHVCVYEKFCVDDTSGIYLEDTHKQMLWWSYLLLKSKFKFSSSSMVSVAKTQV